MTRTVLITGSSGHLGRALCEAFKALPDHVVMGMDKVHGAHTDILCDLEHGGHAVINKPDVVICNAKVEAWRPHHHLALLAQECVVNVASIYGLVGHPPDMYGGTEVPPTPAWYAASKGAMIALTRWQAVELAPRVRVNCVAPGGIQRGHSKEFMQRYCARVPLRRMATESDVVGVVQFLCSDAARYVTGQVIAVDGGLTAM